MDFLQMLNDFFTKFDNILWGVPMIVILLGAHIYMTVRTKFVQRKTFKAIKLSVTKDPDSDGDISPFQALTTALASTIGTGNIVGVATALVAGGPGALFRLAVQVRCCGAGFQACLVLPQSMRSRLLR